MPIRKSTRKNNTEENKVPTMVRAKKTCFFCDNKVLPTYTDAQTLRKFMNDRSRIMAASRTGLCSKHQRVFTREIKHARHLSLLPFIAKV